jgi:prepilin-type N-terminal cleavage/methylation domain-containing protein
MQVLSNKMHGFTLVELIVVLAVSGIMLTVVVGTLGSYYKDNSVSLGRSIQETDTRSVLRAIEKDLYSSIGFGADIADPSLIFANAVPFGSGPANSNPWNHADNGNGPVLIAYKNPVTQQADADSANTRLPVYRQPAGGCGDLSDASPALMAYIYFVAPDPTNSSVKNLYRRTIVPNPMATPLCGTMSPANSSCATNNIAGFPTVCRSSDAVLLKNIKTLAIKYYDPGVLTPYTLTGDPVVDNPHVNGAQTIEIEVETYQRLTNDSSVDTSKASIRINHL